MNVALIGPSGSGKGTHAEFLVKKYNLLHISTGDLFRANLENQTALGLLARRYMSQGELVPDEVVDAMVEECLRKADPTKGMLFDGFPRTPYQARFLDELLSSMGRRVDAVVYLKVPDEEIVTRLSGRLICRNCHAPWHTQALPPARPGLCNHCGGELAARPEDQPDAVPQRLKVFHRETDPLIGYYHYAGRLIIIDGSGPLETVRSSIDEALEAVAQRSRLSATDKATAEILAQRPPAPAIEAKPFTAIDFVLLGAPGSGKGTQAEQLTKRYGLPHVATGDLFRENLRLQTDLGKLAKTYMDRGELVPDNVTEAMVRERLSRSDTLCGFLLDGFPRTLPQAQALNEILAEMKRNLAAVIYINVPDHDIIERLSGRTVCRKCQTPYHTVFKKPAQDGVCDNCGGELYQRDDDNPETVKARLRTFHGQTAPLVEYYRSAGILVEVCSGGWPVERTTATVRAEVERIVQQRLVKLKPGS
jgi:adenylate kinase